MLPSNNNTSQGQSCDQENKSLESKIKMDSTSMNTTASPGLSFPRSRSRSGSQTSSHGLSKSQIWAGIQRQVIRYLRESREDLGNVKSSSTPSEKTLHALLLSTGGKGGETGHEIEMFIIVRLLELIERGKMDINKYKPKRDERPNLLKLVVWCLHSWKTMSRASPKERKSCISSFEHCFLKTLGQIRIESAISTKVEPSTKCLGLISLMKNIQKGWVGLLVSTPTMTSNIIDNMEEKVIGHVEEKMKLPMGIKEDLLCFRRFCTLKNRLEYVCNGDANTTPGTKAIQGMLIKELVQVFCDSVEKDMAHRDHIFIHELVTKTANSNTDYKRCLVWVMMKILPVLKEKSCGGTRLISCSQGLIRSILNRADTQSEKDEVSVWNQILQSTLSTDDLSAFYTMVMTRKFMNRFSYTDKVFEDFFPVRRNEELCCNEKQVKETKEPWEMLTCVISTLDEEPDSSDPWEIKETVDWDMVT